MGSIFVPNYSCGDFTPSFSKPIYRESVFQWPLHYTYTTELDEAPNFNPDPRIMFLPFPGFGNGFYMCPGLGRWRLHGQVTIDGRGSTPSTVDCHAYFGEDKQWLTPSLTIDPDSDFHTFSFEQIFNSFNDVSIWLAVDILATDRKNSQKPEASSDAVIHGNVVLDLVGTPVDDDGNPIQERPIPPVSPAKSHVRCT